MSSSTAWAAASAALAALPAAAAATIPMATIVTTSPSGTTTSHETLLAHEGASLLVVLAVPLGVAVLGAAFARSRLAAAWALTLFVVLGLASVGLGYVPAAAAMWVARRLGRTRPACTGEAIRH